MPTYLLHGFRWQRLSIIMHVILQDLEEASPEWIMAPATSITILNSLYTLYDFLPQSNPPTAPYPTPTPNEDSLVREERPPGPRTLTKKNKESMASLRSLGRKQKATNASAVKIGEGHMEKNGSSESGGKSATKPPNFNEWSVVKLVEQYDPNDLQVVSQPYAYVADYMVEVKLGASISEEISKYEAKLRSEEPALPSPLLTPGTPGTSSIGAAGNLTSLTMSARELRRKSRRLGWFEKLRDGLQKGEEIGWFVVVCGDEERMVPEETLSARDSQGSEDSADIPKKEWVKGLFGMRKAVRTTAANK